MTGVAIETSVTEPAAAALIGPAVRELLRISPAVHGAIADRLGIGVTDLLALDHATASPTPLGVVALGRRLGIRSASATVLVDRLVAAGHLQRGPHPTDRRRTTLHPTDAARREIRAALHPLLADLDLITGALEESEAAAVLGFLHQITAVLDAFVTSAPPSAGGDRMSEPMANSVGNADSIGASQ